MNNTPHLPHIRKRGDFWLCGYKHLYAGGCGATPAEAYADWLTTTRLIDRYRRASRA